MRLIDVRNESSLLQRTYESDLCKIIQIERKTHFCFPCPFALSFSSPFLLTSWVIFICCFSCFTRYLKSSTFLAVSSSSLKKASRALVITATVASGRQKLSWKGSKVESHFLHWSAADTTALKWDIFNRFLINKVA